MALKQLMLARKIEQRKQLLEELNRKGEEFAKRSADIESAVDDASTDEEFATVEEEVEKLNTEKAEHDDRKAKLEEEIAGLEDELEELNDKGPKRSKEEHAEHRSTHQNVRTEGALSMKISNGFFVGMERSRAEEIVQRQDVRDFLTNIRERNVPKESQLEKRAVTGAELGIPDVILGLIRDNLHRYSKLISKVNLRPLGGTSRLNIVGDIPEAIWTEACGKLNELDIFFNQIEIDGYKVGGYISICNATLQDSDFNLANEIMDMLGQAMGLAIDKAVLYGTGRKMPVGIVTRLSETAQPAYWGNDERDWVNLSGTNVGQVTGADAKEMFANLVRFSGRAKANYGGGEKFWAMNENTYTEIQARMVEFNAAGAIVSSVNNTMPIIGGEIVILPFMQDGDIVGGYGSHYILAERAGAYFAASEHVQFIEDNTVYKATSRYDGRPILGNGFVAMNITGAAPATTMAFAPDEANTDEAPAV